MTITRIDADTERVRLSRSFVMNVERDPERVTGRAPYTPPSEGWCMKPGTGPIPGSSGVNIVVRTTHVANRSMLLWPSEQLDGSPG